MVTWVFTHLTFKPSHIQMEPTNILGYHYEIIYKKGRENVIIDALSCQYEE